MIFCGIMGCVNGANFTDGLDGLASSVTIVIALFFTVASVVFFGKTAPDPASLAMLGALAAFLIFNHYPAKVFMGDTGSLALGGALAALAVSCGAELFLPIAGGIYVAEALSVIIQVYVFKTQNGRRFFRMAPLHHHYELGGWSEVKIVTVFSCVTAVLCLIAWLGLVVIH